MKTAPEYSAFPRDDGTSGPRRRPFYKRARTILPAFMAGLFPGVFEETGRLVAFRTVLRHRRSRETAISHGIGHGGFEVVLLGITYIEYIAFGITINTGTFQPVIDQLAAQAPNQLSSVEDIVATLTAFSFGSLVQVIMDRVFAAMDIFGVISISTAVMYCFAALFGLGTFFGSYLLLYRKDTADR